MTDSHPLDRFISEHLPSIHNCGICVVEDNDTELVLAAPLALNHNDHDKAFGSAIYNIMQMACWGTLWLECQQHSNIVGPQPNILTRDGQIRYRQQYAEAELRARCRKPIARQWDGFFAHYEKTGKTSLSLTAHLLPDLADPKNVAAYFDGVFVLLEE